MATPQMSSISTPIILPKKNKPSISTQDKRVYLEDISTLDQQNNNNLNSQLQNVSIIDEMRAVGEEKKLSSELKTPESKVISKHKIKSSESKTAPKHRAKKPEPKIVSKRNLDHKKLREKDIVNPNKQNNEKREPTVDRVIHIHNFDEYQKFKENYPRGVVFYGAVWCHACKDIEPLYKRICNRYHKRVALAHVDIDEAKLDFTAVPVFVALRNGKQIDNLEGADKDALKALIKKVIKSE